MHNAISRSKFALLIIGIATALLFAVGTANAQQADEKVLYVVSVNDLWCYA